MSIITTHAIPSPISILIVDDHPIVCDGLAAVLGTQPDFAVVGIAHDGDAAIQKVVALRPDVLLLDLEMPILDGVATLQRLSERSISIRTIVFTAFDTDDRIVEAVRAGAHGYLLKGAPREELFNAIRVIHAGGSLLQPIVATRLIRRLNQPPVIPQASPLSVREAEVLALLAQGSTNRQIATHLTITERTAKFHLSSLMNKLGANNRTEVVAIATQRGLLKG